MAEPYYPRPPQFSDEKDRRIAELEEQLASRTPAAMLENVLRLKQEAEGVERGLRKTIADLEKENGLLRNAFMRLDAIKTPIGVEIDSRAAWRGGQIVWRELEPELDQLRAERDELKKELDEARQALKNHLEDSGVTCAYCGAYHPRPCTLEDLQAHVFECPKHPLAAMKKERDAARAENVRLQQVALKHLRESERLEALVLTGETKQVLEKELHAARAECAAVKDAAQKLLDLEHSHVSPAVTERAWEDLAEAVKSPIGTAYRERVERLVKAARTVVEENGDDWLDGLRAALKEWE